MGFGVTFHTAVRNPRLMWGHQRINDYTPLIAYDEASIRGAVLLDKGVGVRSDLDDAGFIGHSRHHSFLVLLIAGVTSSIRKSLKPWRWESPRYFPTPSRSRRTP